MVRLSERFHLPSIQNWISYYNNTIIEQIVGDRAKIIPKLWTFGSFYSEEFSQNSKYLFLYVSNNCPDITAVWISKNQSVLQELRENGYDARHPYSRSGMYALLRSEYSFIVGLKSELGFWGLGANGEIVNLWHGIPIKDVTTTGRQKRKFDCDYFVVTSEYTAELFAEYEWLESPKSKFRRSQAKVLGYPRNDVLFNNIPGSEIGGISASELNLNEDINFLYSPTHRPYAANNPILQHENIKRIDKTLSEIGATLSIKMHPSWELHDKSVSLKESDFCNVRVIPSDVDVYPVLAEFDALITDYSSIYYDYLLLERPIILFPFDEYKYREQQGFHIDYEDLPGKKPTSVENLIECMISVVDKNLGFSSEKIKQKVFGYCDGESSKRIYEEFSGNN